MTNADARLKPSPHRTIVSMFVLFLIFLMSLLVLLVPENRDDEMYKPKSADEVGLNNGDTAFMCICSALVLLMTPGLAFFYGGMVRSNNLVSTLLQSFVIMGLIMMLWIIIGFSLAFGEDEGRVIGNPATHFFFKDVGALTSGGIPITIYALFQGTFAIITPALITGAVAERVNFIALMFFVAIWHIVVYCPLAHMEWHPEGLIHHFGHKDFAGGTVVHMSSGYSALVLAHLVGKRSGDKESLHAPVHTPYVLLGTALLWFGWFGFNGGSELAADELAAQALITTNVAAGTAMFTWVVWDYIMGRKISVIGTCGGLVVGLVTITPACAYVTVGASMVMGMIGAVISNVAMNIMKSNSLVDDTLDVFACHGLGGTTGMILTALFANSKVYDPLNEKEPDDEGLFYGTGHLLLNTVVIAICVIAYCMVVTAALYFIINLFVNFRVSSEDEEAGLDPSYHGELVNMKMQAGGSNEAKVHA